MAPHRRLTWRTLLIGIIAIAALAGAAFWVLAFARVGALHGDRYHVTLLTDDANRVIQGTEVWLEGQKVGLVADVRLRPVSTDSAHRIAIDLELLSEYQPQIRADSHAQLRHAGSPIGAPVVMLTVGTAAAPVLADGDTLIASPTASRQQLMDELADASRNVPHLAANVDAILHDLDRTAAQMHALPAAHTTGIGTLARHAMARISTFGRRRASRDRASRPRSITDSSAHLHVTATRLASDVRRMRTTAASGHGTIGRLQRDTSLGVTLGDVGRQLSRIGWLLDESRGSAGRFLHDSAIAHQLHRNR